VYPLYLRFEGRLGGRRKLALPLFTVLALALLIVPTVMLTTSTLDTVTDLSAHLDEEGLKVPPPSASVKEWPVVGDRVYGTWSKASDNLAGTIKQYAPEIKKAGKWLLNTAAGAGLTMLMFLASIIIASVFMANADAIKRFFGLLSTRIAREQGADFAELTSATVRSVTQGVLGVAFIQSLLAGIGMLVMGVPGAGLWAFLVLLLAVMQLPPILVLGPVMVYVFSVADTVPAVLFIIWGVLVSASDAFLKPMFLGRGLDIPMLVILIGALGGMVVAGIIGLFLGAVLLALAYRLFMAWLEAVPEG
jgi:predicted PurR-regulated permease PerM